MFLKHQNFLEGLIALYINKIDKIVNPIMNALVFISILYSFFPLEDPCPEDFNKFPLLSNKLESVLLKVTGLFQSTFIG